MKRFIGNVKAWITFSPTSRPHKALKQKLITVKKYLNQHPKLKTTLIQIIDYFPAFKRRLQQVGKAHKESYHRHTILTESHLSPKEKMIYLQLKKLKNTHLKEL